MGVSETDPLSQLNLPPGFRFYPTDEELLVQYLCRKVSGHHFSPQIISDIDLYKFDPWVLPSKALFGVKEWYFFTPRERKYPNGSRPNRVAGSGYWKATGTDKAITTAGRKVGIKKALVFYVGKAPKGTKTNWIMHEYRLAEPSRKNGSSRLDDWVLCRIYKKNSGSQKPMSTTSLSIKEHSNGSCSSSSSHLDDVLESFPEIDDRFSALPRMNSPLQQDDKINNLQLHQLGSGNFDWATLAGLNSVVPGGQTTQSRGVPSYANDNDVYVPSVPQMCHVDSGRVGHSVEEEVQSGFRNQRVDNSGVFQPNSAVLTQPSLANPVDLYGFRYPTQDPGFGSRH